jgi:hypothetical protein
MRDHRKLDIEIYHEGVVFKAPIRGKKRYLQEKAFLDELTGARYSPKALPRPVPDPHGDFYMLDDEQLDAYSAFRKKMRKQG